jgi:hypothetical protein
VLKVPAYPFIEESETFSSQHNVHANSEGEFSAVVKLEDVSLVDFKHFLNALLPKCASLCLICRMIADCLLS